MIFVRGLGFWCLNINKSFFGRLKILFFVDVWFLFGVYGYAVKVHLLCVFDGKGSFFGSLKVLFFVDIWFPFGVYGCGVKVCLLWGFWWKRKIFLGFHDLVFCLGFSCLNIIVSSVYGGEKDGLLTYFKNVFLLNEWCLGGLVGFSRIVCWH